MKESGKDRFLIDGFPRNRDNLDGWQKQVGDKVQECFVLLLSCTEEVGRRFVRQRFVFSNF